MAEDWMFLFFMQAVYSTIKQLENGAWGAPVPTVFPASKKEVGQPPFIPARHTSIISNLNT